MKTLMLAVRNLRRNARRSLTTLLAMVIGLVTVLLFGGYVRNITYGLQTGFVQRSGHLQLQRKDYFLFGTGNPAAYGIAGYQRVIERVRGDPVLAPMITVVTPSLQVGGLAGNFAAGVSRTVVGDGVVVEDQNRMRTWNDYNFPVQTPPSALTGTAGDAAVVGTGVARVLELCAPLKVADCPQAVARPRPAGAALPDDIGALAAGENGGGANGTGTGTVTVTATGTAIASAGAKAGPPTPRIEMLAANVHGAPNVASLGVVKAADQGVKELDDMYIGMHLAQAQRLVYGNDPPQATSVLVQLRHTRDMPVARARLNELIAGDLKGDALEVLDFATLNPFYGQANAMFGTIFGFLSILIGAIVLFTVGNTMSMAVVERTTEIGTLRAMGLRRGGIRALFLSEGLMLGLLGTVVGVLGALGLAWLVNHSGASWTPPGNVQPVPLTIGVWGEYPLIVGSTVGMLLVALLSALLPAHRASRLNIVDALRHV